jgi:hypothetical protein
MLDLQAYYFFLKRKTGRLRTNDDRHSNSRQLGHLPDIQAGTVSPLFPTEFSRLGSQTEFWANILAAQISGK